MSQALHLVPPHSLEDEGCVLSRVLDDAEDKPASSLTTIAQLGEILRPVDFYSTDNEAIWASVLAMSARAEVPNWNALLRAMTEAGTAGPQRGTFGAYLIDLATGWPHEPLRVVIESARRLRVLGRARRAIEMCHRAAAAGYAITAEGAEAYLGRLASSSAELVGDLDSATMLAAPEAVAEAQAARKQLASARLPSGFPSLDRVALFGPGKFAIVAGRPGMGKTQIAVQIAANVAARPLHAAAVFSLEMSRSDLVDRIISAHSQVALPALQRGLSTTATTEAETALASSGLIIDGDPILPVSQLLPRIRLAKAKALQQGRRLRLVVIDYLQLMVGDRRRSREEQVAETSRASKLAARAEDVLVIGVAQLNREVERRNPPRPVLSDLRESGALEQDADIVMMMFRPAYYDKAREPGGEVAEECEVIVAKQRNGPTGLARLQFTGACCRFAEFGVTRPNGEPDTHWND